MRHSQDSGQSLILKFFRNRRAMKEQLAYGKKPVVTLPRKRELSEFIFIPLTCAAIFFGCGWMWKNVLYPQSMTQLLYYGFEEAAVLSLFNNLYIPVGIIIVITLVLLRIIIKRRRRSRSAKAEIIPSEWGLWLGESTGQLIKRHHGAGLSSFQNIILSAEDASQNILILGAIGSGKTTCAMHPLLIQTLDQGCGGLIFDIKGDFKAAVEQFTQLTNRSLVCIGPQGQAINLLSGLNPELASSFLKSIFMLNNHNRGDSFWIDTATELCRHILGVLSFSPQYYSLHGLYQYLFEPQSRREIDKCTQQIKETLLPLQERLLDTYLRYYKNIFGNFDEKVQAGVHATIAQVLSPFNHPQLIDSFCSSTAEDLSFEDVLKGMVYLVEFPLSQWGLSGKVIYALIKLRFYNVMQQRSLRPEWDQEKPVFFMCDEFQEIVTANRDGLSDLNFWDKSRSSKTIGIVSSQSISSFYAAIGDRDIANALLQNFRQKLCFRTEDQATLDYLNRLTGQVEVPRKVASQSHSTEKSDISSSESITYFSQNVIEPQLVRLLKPHQCIALLSLSGKSKDDIIDVEPVYV